MLAISARQKETNSKTVLIDPECVDVVRLLKRLKRAYRDFQGIGEYLHINGMKLLDVEIDTEIGKPIFVCRNLNNKQLYFYFDKQIKSIKKQHGKIEAETKIIWDWK